MQQTSKYQFKLIEGTDDFSPTPLNDNMEKVENALTALDVDLTEGLETVADVIATFSANLGSGGHTCRLVFGTYQGDGAVRAEPPQHHSGGVHPGAVLPGLPGTAERAPDHGAAAHGRRGAPWRPTTSPSPGWTTGCSGTAPRGTASSATTPKTPTPT